MFLVQTGGDGCICYLEYDRDHRTLEFIGMKQVKELSLIQSVSADNDSLDNLASGCHAAGFASVDFIIWNFLTETKVLTSTAYVFKTYSGYSIWCLRVHTGRLCKYHVVDGGVLTLIILVMYQRCRTALHMSRLLA